MRGFLIVILLLGILGVAGFYSLYMIPDGKVGVATVSIPKFGSRTFPPRVLKPGPHLSWPWVTHIQLYTTRVQMLYLDLAVGNGDAVRFTAQVRLDPDSAVAVDHRLGPAYLREVVRPTITAYLVNEIAASKGAVDSPAVQLHLRSTLESALAVDGLRLDEAILTRVGAAIKAGEEPDHAADQD